MTPKTILVPTTLGRSSRAQPAISEIVAKVLGICDVSFRSKLEGWDGIATYADSGLTCQTRPDTETLPGTIMTDVLDDND